MMLSTKIDTDTASGSVRFSVENYSSIFDAKTKNTEVEYRGFVDLEIHGSNYDYESYNEDTYEYKKIPFDLFSTMSFDVKVILSSDGTSYIQVVKLSALSHGDKTIKKNFDESMTSFQKYVGKTYKLPTSLTQGSQLDPEFIQKNILNALNILDQKPLFTVLSKQEDSYSLGLNILTLKSLGWTPYKR